MAFGLLSGNIPEGVNFIEDKVVYKVSDSSIIGFEISEDKKRMDLYHNFLTIFDESPNILVVKTSFSIGNENDLKYILSSYNAAINFDTMRQKDDIKSLPEFIDKQKEENKILYSNLVAVEERENNNMMVEITGDDGEGGFFKALLKVPLYVYTKLSIIKAEINNHMPINYLIDDGRMFENIEFHDNCKVNYFGADYSHNKLIVGVFKLTTESETYGLLSAIPEIEGKIVTKQSINRETLGSLFNGIYSIDMRNVLLFDFINSDGELDNKVCILTMDKQGGVRLYRLNCDYDECQLLHPYKYVY